MKQKIEEMNLSDSMKYVYDTFIKDYDTRNLLAYKPVSQKDTGPTSGRTWIKDNPTTGIIYLKKHPNAKEAWVLVKFESTEKSKRLIPRNAPQNYKTIRNEEEFEEFFGVKPSKGFTDDTIIVVSWGKEEKLISAQRDFDETTPNFYMYVNHLKTNRAELVKRLYRINDIIDTKGSTGDLFSIPYNLTNL